MIFHNVSFQTKETPSHSTLVFLKPLELPVTQVDLISIPLRRNNFQEKTYILLVTLTYSAFDRK